MGKKKIHERKVRELCDILKNHFRYIDRNVFYHNGTDPKSRKAELDILAQNGDELCVFEFKMSSKGFYKAKLQLSNFEKYMGFNIKKFYIDTEHLIPLNDQFENKYEFCEKIPLKEFLENPLNYVK